MWVYLYMCEYVEKYHICGLKVGVHIIHGYLRYVNHGPFPIGGFSVKSLSLFAIYSLGKAKDLHLFCIQRRRISLFTPFRKR